MYIPHWLTSDAKIILKLLLNPNPFERSLITFTKLKSLSFFKEYDWLGLIEKKVKNIPYLPKKITPKCPEPIHVSSWIDRQESKVPLSGILDDFSEPSNTSIKWSLKIIIFNICSIIFWSGISLLRGWPLLLHCSILLCSLIKRERYDLFAFLWGCWDWCLALLVLRVQSEGISPWIRIQFYTGQLYRCFSNIHQRIWKLRLLLTIYLLHIQGWISFRVELGFVIWAKSSILQLFTKKVIYHSFCWTSSWNLWNENSVFMNFLLFFCSSHT